MSTTNPADALRKEFSGQVLEPGQPGYHESRRLFNPMTDRRPAVVARCSTTADVVAAVNVAREHGLVAAVRGGGHSFSGLSTCDDGIQIDLRGLKSMTVDPEARTVRAGGGYGWTSSKYGLACDNLISAKVVLTDGTVVCADERDHADLFWGIRGGGGNFGIVTGFEFGLHPLGPIVLAGLTMFPIDRAPKVLRRWRDWADAAPDEVATGCAVVTAPPEPFVPPELHGKPVFGIIALYVGDPGAGASAV
jgi:FAD/FMN-containing dehydrogenase